MMDVFDLVATSKVNGRFTITSHNSLASIVKLAASNVGASLQLEIQLLELAQVFIHVTLVVSLLFSHLCSISNALLYRLLERLGYLHGQYPS